MLGKFRLGTGGAASLFSSAACVQHPGIPGIPGIRGIRGIRGHGDSGIPGIRGFGDSGIRGHGDSGIPGIPGIRGFVDRRTWHFDESGLLLSSQ
jgi:hypothetical protein